MCTPNCIMPGNKKYIYSGQSDHINNLNVKCNKLTFMSLNNQVCFIYHYKSHFLFCTSSLLLFFVYRLLRAWSN